MFFPTSSSMDLHHSNRETGHLTSTNLCFPEHHGLRGERSFSLESVPQKEDFRSAQGVCQEQDSCAKVWLWQTGGMACYPDIREGSHSPGFTRGSSCESLKGVSIPQHHSESCTVTKPDRPSSWSSLEVARSVRSLRSQQRNSWHHSSGSLASAGTTKSLYTANAQLHTVIEKSPEASPSSRPRQGQSSRAPQESLYYRLYPSLRGENHTGHQHSVAAHSNWGSLSSRSSAELQTTPIPQGPTSPLFSQRHNQLEDPLTRLEMALAEVQGSGSVPSETSCTPGVSVLEKVSCFEHREWATRQQGLSSQHRTGSKQGSDQSLKSVYGREDLKNKSEMRPNSNRVCRTLSCTGVTQDTNRPFRDGEKKSQSEDIHSTPFRRNSCNPLSPPPIPPKVFSYKDKGNSQQLPSPEKKGPKTLPKPHSIISKTRSSPRTAAPSLDSTTPTLITRICGRKRLTSEQKKRSFSEPECMNEIGLTRISSSATFSHAADSSVADRRKMFELAGRSVVDGALQQELQLVPVQKSFSAKREGRTQKSYPRPFSAVFSPPHTLKDSVQLPLSSSLLSLTDCAQEPVATGEQHSYSTYSTVFYPGKVTSPRASTLPPHSFDSSDSSLGESGPQSPSVSLSLCWSHKVDSPQQRSPSAVDLHGKVDCTSLSVPAGGSTEQSINEFSGVTTEGESTTVVGNRVHQEVSVHNTLSSHCLNPATPSVPVPRRERPRRSSRSSLAASVGLPCPLSPVSPPGRDLPSESGQAGPKHLLQESTGQSRDEVCNYHVDDNKKLDPSTPERKTTPLSPRTPAAPSVAVEQDHLVLDYEPVSVRTQSPEEQRVLVLLRTLVFSDRTLAPLMDMWGKSTVDVLKEIFPKSKLFEKLMWQHKEPKDDWSQEPPVESLESSVDIPTTKVELCETLRRCTESLQREKETLNEAFRAHTELEHQVEAWVREHCEGSERDKYCTFIGDLERVVNLLLSLCGRLARIERSMASLRRQEPTEGSTELWDSLIHKQSLLLRQTQEALELRDHLERRQCTVHGILRSRLSSVQLQQYRRLVRSTPALLVDLRRLDDLLRQTQETLSLLLDTVPMEVTQARGWCRVGLTLTTTPAFLMRSQAPPIWH